MSSKEFTTSNYNLMCCLLTWIFRHCNVEAFIWCRVDGHAGNTTNIHYSFWYLKIKLIAFVQVCRKVANASQLEYILIGTTGNRVTPFPLNKAGINRITAQVL